MALHSVTYSDSPTIDPRHQHVRFGAIFTGALVCVAFQILFTLLGTGIGLSVFDIEQGEVPGRGAGIGAGVYAVVTLILSFFIGGYVASKLANMASKSLSVLHGLGSWALVAVFMTFFMASGAIGSLGGLVRTAGIGAGASAGADALFEQLSRMNLRLVSDVKLTAGEVVTYVVTDKNMGNLPDRLAKQVTKDVKKSTQTAMSKVTQTAKDPEAKEAAGDVRKAAAGASWIALLALLLSGGSAMFGGYFPSRRMRRVSDRDMHMPRSRAA